MKSLLQLLSSYFPKVHEHLAVNGWPKCLLSSSLGRKRRRYQSVPKAYWGLENNELINVVLVHASFLLPLAVRSARSANSSSRRRRMTSTTPSPSSSRRSSSGRRRSRRKSRSLSNYCTLIKSNEDIYYKTSLAGRIWTWERPRQLQPGPRPGVPRRLPPGKIWPITENHKCTMD